MIYITNIESDDTKVEQIYVKMHTACCKGIYVYERDKKTGKITLDGVEIGEGMYESLRMALSIFHEGKLRK